MARVVKVLSIDGGGVRGIVPAMLVAELEQRTGRNAADLFDLIVGTSTGGVLALALTRPGPDGRPESTAAELIRLGRHEGRRTLSCPLLQGLYPPAPWGGRADPARTAELFLADRFGSARLSEALTGVLVTAYDVQRRRPFLFSSTDARTRAGSDFRMRDVARAATASRGYVAPARVQAGARAGWLTLVDGAVFANDPAAWALAEATRSHPGEPGGEPGGGEPGGGEPDGGEPDGGEPGGVLLVSLGTGRPRELVRGGPGGPAAAEPRRLLPYGGSGELRYYRLQTGLEQGDEAMDDARPAHVHELALRAETTIDEHDQTLDRIAAELLAGSCDGLRHSALPVLSASTRAAP